jgi:hypothetical protein
MWADSIKTQKPTRRGTDRKCLSAKKQQISQKITKISKNFEK